MPLDFELIDQSAGYSNAKLEKAVQTDCPHLHLLEEFLYPLLLEKICQFVIQPNLPWQPAFNQEYSGRTEITWLEDSVVEETHKVLESLTEQINGYHKRQQKFLGISIWKDLPMYVIQKHTDNNKITSALQIYLNDTDLDLATKFEYNNKIISPLYKSNFGYLVDNTQKIPHWMTSSIPQDYIRYSLYAVWTQ